MDLRLQHHAHRKGRTAVVAAVLLVLVAVPATAQTHSVVLVEVPLDTALATLIERTDIEILYDEGLVRGRTTSCRIAEATVVEILRCVLEGTGLDFLTLSSGVHVLIESPASVPVLAGMIGLIVEVDSRAPVARATVYDMASDTWTTTDDAGRFVVGGLLSGPHPMVVQHVAYETQVDTVWVGGETSVRTTIALTPRIIESETIIVSDFDPLLIDPSRKVEQTGLLEDVRSVVVGAVGGADRLVGVRPGFDGTGAHIDGAGPGESLLLLDGAPVFDPIRNGGFFTSFNPLAVRTLTVFRTGYRAREGSSLAGAIAAEHALPSDLDRDFAVQASPLAVDARGAGSFQFRAGPRLDWMMASRWSLGRGLRPGGLNERLREWSRADTYLANELFETNDDEVDRLVRLLEEQSIILSTADLHLAGRADFGMGRQVYGAVFFADNRFGSDALDLSPGLLSSVSDEYVWRNRTSLLRYSWVVGSRVLMEAAGWNSFYRLQHPFEQSPLGVATTTPDPDFDFNEIVTSGLYLQSVVAHGPGRTSHLEVGLRRTEAEARTAAHPQLPDKVLSGETVDPGTWTWHGSVDTDWTVRGMQFTLGSRAVYLPIRRTVYAEPRVSVRVDQRPSERLSISYRLASGLYRQYLNQFDVASWSLSAVLPTFRIWMPTGRHQGPATSLHFVADVAATTAKGFSLRGRVFARKLLRLVEIDRSPGPRITEEGEGWANGFSLSSHYGRGVVTAAIAYSFTDSRRQSPGRFDGRRVDAPWLQPHVVEASLGLNTRGWDLSLRFESVWGRTWGFRRAYYEYLSDGFASPDADALPEYRQRDLGFGKAWSLGPTRLTLRADILNALGRHNVIERRSSDDGLVTDVFGLPRIPAVSVRVEL